MKKHIDKTYLGEIFRNLEQDIQGKSPDDQYKLCLDVVKSVKKRKRKFLVSVLLVELNKKNKSLKGPLFDEAKNLVQKRNELRRMEFKSVEAAKASDRIFKIVISGWIIMLIGLNIYISLR